MPRSPAQWLETLENRLHARWAEWSTFDDYYEGANTFALYVRSVQQAFSGTLLGDLLRSLTDNYMPSRS